MFHSQDSVALYSALASVAAITTALQASAVLFLLSQLAARTKEIDAASPGTQAETDARKAAKTSRTASRLTNFPAATVSAAVTAMWGVVVLDRIDWDVVLFVPWLAVALAVGGLIVAAGVLLTRFRRLTRQQK